MFRGTESADHAMFVGLDTTPHWRYIASYKEGAVFAAAAAFRKLGLLLHDRPAPRM